MPIFGDAYIHLTPGNHKLNAKVQANNMQVMHGEAICACVIGDLELIRFLLYLMRSGLTNYEFTDHGLSLLPGIGKASNRWL